MLRGKVQPKHPALSFRWVFQRYLSDLQFFANSVILVHSALALESFLRESEIVQLTNLKSGTSISEKHECLKQASLDIPFNKFEIFFCLNVNY